MMKAYLPPLRTLLFPALILCLSLAVALAGGDAQQALRYQRDAIEHGEAWRVLTAHLAHLGWSHLGLNLAGLALIWWLVGGALSFAGWSLMFLATALGTSAGLWLFQPQLQWYVGLSGVLHGLLIAGVLSSWGKYRDGPWLLGLVTIKLLWEQWMGPVPGSAAAAGGPVVVAAHVYGAVSGVAGWGLLRLMRKSER